MRRRIKKAVVKFLSLVPRGANKMSTIFKSDDNTVEFQCLTKEGEEEGEILFCAYAPEHRDSQGDIASAQVIKDMAYSHAQNGGLLDIRHDCKALPKEDVFLAENFLIQKTDERFQNWKDADGNQVNTEGGWGGVIKVEKEELRKKYRDGEWSGVSLYGDALVETEKSDLDGVVSALLEKLSGDKDEMKPEELEAALKKSNEGLVSGIVEGVVKGVGALLTKEDDNKDADKNKSGDNDKSTTVAKAPEFKGDPTDTEALEKHAAELEKWKLVKDVDMSDPEAVAQLSKKLAELKKSGDPEDEEDQDDEPSDERVKRLEKENARLRKRSNQGKKGDVNDPTPALEESGLSKEDALLWERGTAMGRAVNKQRGFASAN